MVAAKKISEKRAMMLEQAVLDLAACRAELRILTAAIVEGSFFLNNNEQKFTDEMIITWNDERVIIFSGFAGFEVGYARMINTNHALVLAKLFARLQCLVRQARGYVVGTQFFPRVVGFLCQLDDIDDAFPTAKPLLLAVVQQADQEFYDYLARINEWYERDGFLPEPLSLLPAT